MLGALLEVEVRKLCTTPARESDLKVKSVKTPGARDVFWGSKCVSRGRRRDFDTLQNTWQAQEFVRVAKTLAGVGDLKRLRNNAFRVAGVVISRFVMSMFQASDAESVEGLQISCHGSYFAVIISRGSYRTSYASAQLFRGRRSTFEACTWKSLKRIVILRSSVCSTCQFWRKSRRNASFLIFKASILKEVSQKSFVLELQSFIFEGSLAEKLRFGASKHSFLKEVSQKCSVFELQSVILTGSLAEKLRFWVSKLQFWRKSRRKVSFLIFKASFLKEVSQKCFVFEFQSFNFEGSLAQKLRLTKSFESHISWQPNHLNLKSFDIQITWISNQLTTNSFESQIDWQPNHWNLRSIDNRITWISNWQPHHLKFKSTDNQNHLKHTSIDNQIIWISNQLTTKSIESQINGQPKAFESQIRWQPNHLTLNSFESDINWLSNHLNSARSLPIGSLSLETSATALCGRYVSSIR